MTDDKDDKEAMEAAAWSPCCPTSAPPPPCMNRIMVTMRVMEEMIVAIIELMEMNRVLLKSFVFQIVCKKAFAVCTTCWIHSLLQVLLREREGAVQKGSFDEMEEEKVDREAPLLVEEEEEELFTEKPVPLWATFDPNEVPFFGQSNQIWTKS